MRGLVEHSDAALNLLTSDDQLKYPIEKAKRQGPRSSWTRSETSSKQTGQSATIKSNRPLEWDGSKEELGLLDLCDSSEQTGSFLHLHLALNATGLDLTTYDIWQGLDRRSPEYLQLKEDRASVLWRAVESVIPDVRDRVLLDLTGSPLTHERFLRRPQGTYGSATEDYLKDGATPIDKLVLAGDGIFPGIGVPAVALSGASAANSLVNPWQHWQCLEKLKTEETSTTGGREKSKAKTY